MMKPELSGATSANDGCSSVADVHPVIAGRHLQTKGHHRHRVRGNIDGGVLRCRGDEERNQT